MRSEQELNTKSDHNYLFILEESEQPLYKSKDDNYVLEGIGAKFNVKNQNNRVYERDEYLPHLEYLKEEVNRNQLVGELDHPQSFDINFTNVSHVVENVWYDDQTDSIRLRIRLLNTPSGKIAKELVDEGVPISISSRAAGEVLNEGKVKLHRIFTYDIVAKGGFGKDAVMQVKESDNESHLNKLTESLDNIQKDSVINNLEDISESVGGDNIKAYKINNNIESFEKLFKSDQIEEKNDLSMSDQYATKQQVTDYINKNVLNRLNELENQIKSISENLNNQSVANKDNNNKDIIDRVSKVESNFNNLKQYVNEEIKTELNKVINYTDRIAESVNGLGKYTEYVSKYLDETIQYAEQLSAVYESKFDSMRKYTEYIAEYEDAIIDHNNHLSERINLGNKYSEYLSEQLDSAIKFSDYVTEQLDEAIQFSDHIGKSLYENIQYTNYISEGLNATVFANSSKYIDTEDIKESKEGEKDLSTMITENYNPENSDTHHSEDINEKVNELISNVKSNKSDEVIEQRHPFMKVLNEQDKEYFKELNNDLKKEISETLDHTPWFNRDDVMGVISQVVEHENKDTPNYIRYMPNDIKPLYNQLSEQDMQNIHAQAQLFDLRTPYQVQHFWYSRDLTGAKRALNEQQRAYSTQNAVNEGQSREGQQSMRMDEQLYGYDVVNQLREQSPKNRNKI
jgi:hypothetical protein